MFKNNNVWFSVILVTLIVFCSVCFNISGSTNAQTTSIRPRDDIATLKKIAAMSVSDQEKPVNQKWLQEWFIDNVNYFVNSKKIVWNSLEHL